MQIDDKNAATISQRRLQTMADGSPRVAQLAALQSDADVRPATRRILPRATHARAAKRLAQLARLSHGSNIGYRIQGRELFLNSHLTRPESTDDFHPHCTTQVCADRTYVGSMRTFYDPVRRRRYRQVDDGVRRLDDDFYDWVVDAHETFIDSIFRGDAD